jgi:hypothetical protein
MSILKRYVDGEWVPVVIGETGPQGEQGIQGIQGDTGDTGLGVPDPIGSEGQVVTVSGSSAVWQNPAVESVNTQTGEVVLDTDDVSEAGNLYYTDARADSRAILFAIALGG